MIVKLLLLDWWGCVSEGLSINGTPSEYEASSSVPGWNCWWWEWMDVEPFPMCGVDGMRAVYRLR